MPRRAVFEARGRAAGPGMEPVAGVFAEGAAGDAHIAAYLEAEPFAVIISFPDFRNLDIPGAGEINRPAATSAHGFSVLGPVPLQRDVAYGGVLDPVPEYQGVRRS